MKLTQEVRLSAKRLFKLAVAGDKINEERILAIVDDVLKRKPRHYIPILKRFVALLKFEIEKQTLTISSAKKMEQSEIHQIVAAMNRLFSQVNYIRSEIDPSLIGGLKIKLGSNVWDDSVRGRLQKVERELAA